MTDLKVEIKDAMKASLDEMTNIVKSTREDIMKMVDAANQKAEDAAKETKVFGSEFADTKAKIKEIAEEAAKRHQDLQNAVKAIETLNEKINAPKGGNAGDDESRKLFKDYLEFARVKHFGENDEAKEFDDAKVSDDQAVAYKNAVELFWKKAVRMPARVQMCEHAMSADEQKALEPLMIRKTISTISHGSRYWMSNEMYGEVIACYDEVTDLSRLFSTVSISRNGIEVMKDNDVEKRALFKCELNCDPARNPTPTAPGTLIIPTHELYDSECITHTMLEDSEVDLQMWLIPRVAEGFSRGRNEKFMFGNGTTEPEGLLRDGKHIEMPASPIAGSVAGQFNWQHLRIMPFQVAKKFQAQGSYMMSRDALMTVFTMSDGLGRPLIDSQLSIGADGVMRLWGYPVVQVDQLPNYLDASAQPVVDAKPIGFGAWHAAYLVVDRKGFFVVRDPAYNPCGVTWHFGQRVGGGVLCENASVFLRIV